MTSGWHKILKASTIRYIRKLIFISLGCLLLIVTLANGQQPKETKRVLILITGQMDVPGYQLSRKGIQTALAKSTDFHFEYFIEYIDWYRFNDTSYEKGLLDLYRNKYSDKKIDLLIAHGYHALRLVTANRQNFLPHVPVVFSTIFKRQLERLDPDKKFAGSLAEIDFEGILNTALNNHPDTRHVAIISGNSKVGRLIEKGIRAAYAAHADKYDFIYLGHLEMEDLLDRLAKLPDHTIVIYYILMLDGAQKEYEPWKVAGVISEAAHAPVYGMADTYMGEGIVGGKLWSYEMLGTKSGEIALRILNGENPADVPISAAGTNINMFDWRQLKRWGIKESTLPEGSIVRYKEWSLWELYRWYIIGALFLLVLEGFIISALIAQRIRGKKAKAEIRRKDNMLEEAHRIARLGSWNWNIMTNELYWADEVFRIFGILPQEFRATYEHFLERIHPEDIEGVKEAVKQVLADPSRNFYNIMYRIITPDGTERVVREQGNVTFDDQGNASRMIGTVQDVTDIRKVEMEADRLKVELSHMDRVSMMGVLTAGIAHEINQPLAAILSNAQAALRFMKNDPQDLEEVKEALHDITYDGKRAGEIVHSIRKMTGRYDVKREEMDLNKTVRKVLTLVRSETIERNVLLSENLQPDIPPVFGDRIQIQQLILNLIMNALGALKLSHTPKPEVIVSTRFRDNKDVILYVSDSGPGIEPDRLNTIFDPFETGKKGGLGIGLSICRSIADSHGGRLWAENQPEGGAVFFFRLPTGVNRDE